MVLGFGAFEKVAPLVVLEIIAPQIVGTDQKGNVTYTTFVYSVVGAPNVDAQAVSKLVDEQGLDLLSRYHCESSMQTVTGFAA